MSSPLLRSPRFLPLFITQALGAMNDNLFKNALVVLLVIRDPQGSAALIAIAGGLFILPYLLCSATAGELADRFDKSLLIRWTKAAELAVAALGAVSLVTANVSLMFATLVGLGIQAAVFGPLKYGILPELLAPDELLRGNATIEAGTFAAILLGTVAGGALIGYSAGPAIVGGASLSLALAGLIAAAAIPRRPPAAPMLRISANPLAQTIAILRHARRNPPVWTSLLGLSWFWALGATFLAQFPVLAATSFRADNRVITLMLTAFTIGIGLGSAATGRLAHGRDARSLVPRAAVGLSFCCWAFAALAATPGASHWTTPGAMLTDPAGLAAFVALLATAACGGLFSVPLYAALQTFAPPGERARTVAANNVTNALFMVVGAAIIALASAAGLAPTHILAMAAALNLLAAWLLRRALAAPVAAAPNLRQESI